MQYDPFAEHRPQKIAEREDEYKARRRQMIISPERLDPFADGKFCSFVTFLHLPKFLASSPFFLFSFFSVFCTNSFYCSTLRPQCNSLPPRLNAFPVVNPFLMYILCRCFSPTINFQLFPTNVSVGSQFISIIAVWDSVVGILIWCMH